MKYFSLFSGIGGFEYGIQRSITKDLSEKSNREETDKEARDKEGQCNELFNRNTDRFTCIGFSEIDKYATQVYKKQFPEHKEYGDVSKIDWTIIPDFELLVGGFPCQSFSIAGKRGGFDDTRGTLFFEIARCLKQKQPRLFLIENVKGLLSHDQGRTFLTILATLDELGYDCQWQVLNSKNFGVPQNRERVFIVGHLRGTSRPEVFPIGEAGEINGGEVQSVSREARPTSKRYKQNNSEPYFSVLQDGQDRPIRIRRLTPVECERLQGFPDGWTEGLSDTQRYKCLGNAVTTNVIEAIVSKLTDREIWRGGYEH